MGKTPIKIASATGTSSLSIDYNNLSSNGLLDLSVRAGNVTNNISLDVKALVERLNLIPGLTVKYEAPIVVPAYLGAVVMRSVLGSTHEFERYVRYCEDSEHSLPWVSKTGNRYSNDDIAAVLANHGFEAQPQFPRQGED